VEYVEVRLMDLDPFVPVGIAAQTMRFLDVFLLHCLASPSPEDTPREIGEIGRNQHAVALRGREENLSLESNGSSIALGQWGQKIVAECQPIAAALDAAHGGAAYRESLAAAAARLADPQTTPSARVLHAMARNHDNAFLRFVLVESTLHKGTLKSRELPREVRERFSRLALESLDKQRDYEAADSLDFETFRQQYLSHDLLKVQ
jgi:glutamate--cysteine ligase